MHMGQFSCCGRKPHKHCHQGPPIDGSKKKWVEETARGPHDASSPLFPLCRYQLNVFTSLFELMLDLLTTSSAHGIPASLKNILEHYDIIVHLLTDDFSSPLKHLRQSSSASKTALEYLQEFIYCT